MTRLLALLLVVAMTAACTTAGEAAAPEPSVSPASPVGDPQADAEASPAGRGQGALRYAVAEPGQIVPADAVTPQARLVVDTLFDSLTSVSLTGAVRPAAAESWEPIDGDPSRWRFHLREGAEFHDGTPVTSQAFAFAWNVAAARGRAGFLLADVAGYDEVVTGAAAELAGLATPDERTLEVRLRRPLGDFPIVAAHPGLGPLHVAAWREDEGAYRRAPIGNGPFATAEDLVPRQFLRVQAFTGWANGEAPANVDEVLFQFLDADAAYVAFQQGRLQIGPVPDDAVPNAVAEHGRSTDGYTGPGLLDGITPSVYLLAFDVDTPPYDDPEVRRALSQALDRAAMAEAATGTRAEPATSLVAPPLRLSDAPTCSACTRDLVAARSTLSELGVTAVRLTFPEEEVHQAIADQVRTDLRAAGVRVVRIQLLPFADYLEEVESGGAVFFRFGWASEHRVARDVLEPLLASEGAHNHGAYRDDRVDAWLAQAAASTSAGERGVASLLAERQAVEHDQAVVPLLHYRHQTVVSDRVVGFVLDPMGLANLEEVRLLP